MKIWHIEFSEKANKSIRKISTKNQERIFSFIESRLTIHPNPRFIGDQLKGTLNAYWRFRVGDYRIITSIEDKRYVIFIEVIAHRKHVYKKAV